MECCAKVEGEEKEREVRRAKLAVLLCCMSEDFLSPSLQVEMRDLVGAGGSEATWRELSGLTEASRIQVWVTATTVAGEGSQSPRLTAIPKPTPSYAPIVVGGAGRKWRVGVGSGVTLGCRGLGTPTPTVSWTKGGTTLSSGPLTQLLPGGDLHLTGEWWPVP